MQFKDSLTEINKRSVPRPKTKTKYLHGVQQQLRNCVNCGFCASLSSLFFFSLILSVLPHLLLLSLPLHLHLATVYTLHKKKRRCYKATTRMKVTTESWLFKDKRSCHLSGRPCWSPAAQASAPGPQRPQGPLPDSPFPWRHPHRSDLHPGPAEVLLLSAGPHWQHLEKARAGNMIPL